MTTLSSATSVTSALTATYRQLDKLKAQASSVSGSVTANSSSTLASAISSANTSNRVATLLGTSSSRSTTATLLGLSSGSSAATAASTLLSTGSSSQAAAFAQSISALYSAGNRRIASLSEEFSGATASTLTASQKASLNQLMQQVLTSQSQGLIALSA